jgi:hypothetical protein
MPTHRRTIFGAFHGLLIVVLLLPALAAVHTGEFYNLIQHPDLVPSSLVVTNDNAVWESSVHKIVATDISSGLSTHLFHSLFAF